MGEISSNIEWVPYSGYKPKVLLLAKVASNPSFQSSL